MISGLDTHETVKRLTAAGFTEAQAEAVTAAVTSAATIDLSNIATKTDLGALRAATKTDLEALRAATKTDLEALRAATKTDLETLRAAIKTDLDAVRAEMALLRAELEAKIERGKVDMIKWVVGMGFAQVAMVVALLRLIGGGHP